jgi:eukaryotic-like serine/threonine-protein kinase
MAAPTTIEAFVELGVRSGLLDPEIASAPPASDSTLADFVDELIQKGQLTRFQAEKLMNGRWRGFVIAGKYRLLERLGAGGMGAVYLCEHLTMGRRVALKVLPLAQAEDPASLQRFYREARAVARLDHPNIIRAHDLDHEENLHFLVLEFVDGCNLHDFVRRNGPLSPLRTAHYLRQAALGLAHAQTADLVHRDIKPSNMLLDRNGCVKLLDMGLAQFFDEGNSSFVKEFENGYVIGTADYLAPEQVIDSQVDIRADIYSLGCTGYFLLTGRSPFQEGTSHQKMLWHQVRMPKPITKYRQDIPEGLLRIIECMMAKEPERRYQTPVELAEVLADFTATPIPPPAVNEMPPMIITTTGRPSSHTSRATEPIAQNTIATPSPRRIVPKPPLTGTGN